ncbi:MAG: hypothetical protein IKB02_03875 [Clostridia bacterium]|nr:hypothetical protein [Clostridia bacterium]
MKKLLSIMLVAVMLFAVAIPVVSAEEAEGTVIEPAKDMAVYYANNLTGQTLPVIDGTINAGEYGNVVTIGEPTPMAKEWPDYGYIIDRESDRPRSGNIEYYFAYDETSIYIAFKEYGATFDDGNTAFQDFSFRSNYSFGYGFQLDDMTNYLSHSVSYGGGCWNKQKLSFSDGKLSNFTATEITPDQFYSELFVHKYKADEADLPEDERTLWVYGDVLSASNQNSSAPYIMEVEMRLDKQQVIEVFNSVAYTEYAECPNAMYFRMTLNTYRGGAEEGTSSITAQNKYLITDISALNDAQKTKFYMDYGMLPGSPTQVLPALVVFDEKDAPIMIPADKVETEPEETEPEVTEPEETEAPTNENPTEAPETEAPEVQGGCGGAVSLAGIALVAALGTCTAFVAKKKED